MARNSSAPSRKAPLKRVSSEEIKSREWTEQEKQAIRQIARNQIAGDDSKIDFSDIPPLTKHQMAKMIPLQEVKNEVTVSVRHDPMVSST